MNDFTHLDVAMLIQSPVQPGSSVPLLRKFNPGSLLSVLDFASLSFSLASRCTLDSFALVPGKNNLGTFVSCYHMTLEVSMSLQSVSHTGSALLPIAHGNMETLMLAFDLVQSDSLLLLGLKKPFEPLLAVAWVSALRFFVILMPSFCSGRDGCNRVAAGTCNVCLRFGPNGPFLFGSATCPF